MTYYIINGTGLSYQRASSILRNKLVAAGLKEGTAFSSDVYFKYMEDTGEKLTGNSVGFYEKNGNIIIVDKAIAKVGVTFDRLECSRVKLDENIFKAINVEKIRIDLVNYLLKKVDKIELPEFLPTDCLRDIVAIQRLKVTRSKNSKWAEGKTQLSSICKKYNISDKERDTLIDIIGDAFSYSGRLLNTLREVKGFYHNESKLIFPNISDSIVNNVLNMLGAEQRRRAVKPNRKDTEQKKKYQLDKIGYERNKAFKAITSSLFSKNAWHTYAKKSQVLKGVYSLFIPDDSMDDGEVRIPKPERIQKEGEYYPKIGEEVINLRHPVTTIFVKAKVVGYTTDGSIRCNFATMLAFYGDADGDAQLVAWAPWMKSMTISEANTVSQFNKAADIVLEDSDFNNRFDINHFLSLKPEDDAIVYEKSVETGLEQAQAKRVTTKCTGSFGAVERDIAQTLMAAGIIITDEMLVSLSWLSQVCVQAKNILEQIKKSPESLEERIKETFVLMVLMSRNHIEAAKKLSPLLGVSVAKSLEIINTYFDNDSHIIEIEEEVEEETSNLDGFYDSWTD